MIDSNLFSSRDPFFSKNLTFSSSEAALKSHHSISEFIQELFKYLRRGWAVYFIPNRGMQTFECRIVRKLAYSEKGITEDIEEKVKLFTAPRLKDTIEKALESLTRHDRYSFEDASIQIVNNTHLVFGGRVSSDSITIDTHAIVIERSYNDENEQIISRTPGENDLIIKEFSREKTVILIDEKASLSAIEAVLPECDLMSLTDEEQLLFQERIPGLLNMICGGDAKGQIQCLELLHFFSTIPALKVKNELKNKSTCGVIKKLLEHSNGFLPSSLLIYFIQLTEAASLNNLPCRPWALLFRNLILNTPKFADGDLFSLFLKKVEAKVTQDREFSSLITSVLTQSSDISFYSRALLFLDEPFYLHRLLECPYDYREKGTFEALPEKRRELFDRFYARSLERKKSSDCLQLIFYQEALLGLESCYHHLVSFWSGFPEERGKITDFIEAIVRKKIAIEEISILEGYEALYALSSIASWLERMEGFAFSDTPLHIEILAKRLQHCIETKDVKQGVLLVEKGWATSLEVSFFNSYLCQMYEAAPGDVFQWVLEKSPDSFPYIIDLFFSKSRFDSVDLLVSQLCGDGTKELSFAIKQRIAKSLIPYFLSGSKNAIAMIDSAAANYLSSLEKEDRLQLSVQCAGRKEAIHIKLFALALPDLEGEELWIPSQNHTINKEWFSKLLKLRSSGLLSESLFARYVLCYFESILDELMNEKEFLQLLFPQLQLEQRSHLAELFKKVAEDVDRKSQRFLEPLKKEKKGSRSVAFRWLTLLPPPLINAFLKESNQARLGYLSLAHRELESCQKLPDVVLESIQSLIDSSSNSFNEEVIRKILSLPLHGKQSFNFDKFISVCIDRLEGEKGIVYKIGQESTSRKEKIGNSYIEFLTVWMGTHENHACFSAVQAVIQKYIDAVDFSDDFNGIKMILTLPEDQLKRFHWSRLICIFLTTRPLGLKRMIRKIIRSSGTLHKTIFLLFPTEMAHPRLKFRDLVHHFSDEILILEKIEFDDEIGSFASQMMEKIVPRQGFVEKGEYFEYDSTYALTLETHPDAKLFTTSLARVLLKGGSEYASTLSKFYKACHFIDLHNGAFFAPISLTIELYLDYVTWAIKYAPDEGRDVKNGLHRIFKFFVEKDIKLTTNQVRMIQGKITALIEQSSTQSSVTTILALIFLNELLLSRGMIDEDVIHEILWTSGLALSVFEYAARSPFMHRESGIEYTTLSVLSKWEKYLRSLNLKFPREMIQRIKQVDQEITSGYLNEISSYDRAKIESILADNDSVVLFGNKILHLLSFKLQKSIRREVGFLRELSNEEVCVLLKMLIPLGKRFVEQGVKHYLGSGRERDGDVIGKILNEIRTNTYLDEQSKNEMSAYLLRLFLI